MLLQLMIKEKGAMSAPFFRVQIAEIHVPSVMLTYWIEEIKK